MKAAIAAAVLALTATAALAEPLLDCARPEVTKLIVAMLRARGAVEQRTCSQPTAKAS
jgi:hypothetical protein